jgi:hypothetical protein
MNRRSFLKTMLAGSVAPRFLPGAGRRWAKTGELWTVNQGWVVAPFEIRFIVSGYHLFIEPISIAPTDAGRGAASNPAWAG